MFNTIIFSFANQLLLQQTILFLDNKIKSKNNVVVICNENNKAFYQDVENKNKDKKWLYINENNLKHVLLEELSLFDKNSITMFLDSGDIIIDSVNIDTINQKLFSDDVLCFSLRLGENIKHCSRTNTVNNLNYQEIDENCIKWEWSKHYLDFGAPFVFNGHIFKTKEIKKLFNKVKFKFFHEIEESFLIFDNYPVNYMVSFKKSKCVKIIDNNNEYNKDINYVDKLQKNKIDRCDFLITEL